MHKILASLCAAALAAFTGVAAQAEIPAQTIRLAHTAAVSHAHHEAAQLFAKNVSDRTKGKVKVEVYPAGELGDQPALAASDCVACGVSLRQAMSFSLSGSGTSGSEAVNVRGRAP